MFSEILVGSFIAYSVMNFAEDYQPKQTSMIKHTFRNIGYKAGDKEPKITRIRRKKEWKEFIFNVPYGLVDDPKLQPVLQKTLMKPVHVYFDGKLHVRIYKKKIPKKIAYDWQSTNGWTVPIGQTQEQHILHDFDKIPHMTISGMTRQGKTVLLKLILTHLIYNHPDDAQFHIIDLKGGLEFGWYEQLQQVHKVASNVYEAHSLLTNILKSIREDMSMFKSKGYTNVTESNVKQRKFIVVDEAAELVPPTYADKEEKKIYQYCQYALSDIARIAGGLGYRLIFCTQYPTGGTNPTMPKEVKQNTDAKISFRLPTSVASRVAIDENGAEELTNVGRAVYRSTYKEIMQVPYVSDRDIKENLKEWIVNDTNREMEPQEGKDIVSFG